MQEEMLQKIAYCFIPLLMEQLLLCAASALFAETPVVGVIAGHVLTAGMCIYLLRRDEGMPWVRSSGMVQGGAEVRWPGPSQARVEMRSFRHTCVEEGALGKDRSQKDSDGRRWILRFTGSNISAGETMIWAAAACSICLLCTYALNIMGLAGTDEAYTEANAVIEEAPGLLRFILVIIVAPVSEELLYRGVLYHRATVCFGERTGFLASVAAFALSHGNLVQGIAACVSGILLTAACRRCAGRLWLPIFLHSVINACSLYVVPMLFTGIQ